MVYYDVTKEKKDSKYFYSLPINHIYKIMNETKIVNLQYLASQLEQTAKPIEGKVKNTDNRFNIIAGMLMKKIPELKNFGTNTTVFQARWTNEGMKIEVPRVCKSIESESVITQLPDLEILKEVEYISYITGLSGYAIIKVGECKFQIALAVNLDLEDELENVEGEGIPPIEVIGYEKRPEIPLKSDLIPVNEELTVIGNGRKSREYQTPLCDVKISRTGEIIKNVLCNSQLERLIVQYDSKGKCKFKVTKKTKLKDGKTKVSILDLNGVDFCDLEV